MKKTALTIFAGIMALCSYAQTGDDALLFSENEYEGTARTMAMGNAFTALGGDLGSIGLNPAGSAVAGYSQVTITPGITFSSSTTAGVSPYKNGSLPYFERQMKSRTAGFNVPNLGVTLNFDTGRKTGIKNFTFGFIMNQTGGWNEDTYAAGTNSTTSFMGSMAYWASNYYGDGRGIPVSVLSDADAYRSGIPWEYIVGYQSEMISPYDGYNDRYVGASQAVHKDTQGNYDFPIPGTLEQAYGRRVTGGKYDYVLNLGANISDFIYIGANLGMTTLDYSQHEYFKETAVDPYEFELGTTTAGDVLYFNNMKYQHEYSAEGIGYYGKIGVIITPGYGLRIGAAIQTPTVNNITERWYQEGETYNGVYYASETSLPGEFSYKLTSPYRANFGLAYTIGQFGVVSADYEFCDYSTMRFKAHGYDMDSFEEENNRIRQDFKASHALRIGAEIKPIPELSVRAGYGMTTNPHADPYAPAVRSQNISFGLGYSSKGSFFADLAVKTTLLNEEYIMPYADYIFEKDDAGRYILDKNGDRVIATNGFAPQISNMKSLWKVALTFGWRF